MQQISATGDVKTIQKLAKLVKSAEKDSAFRVATRIRAIMLSIENRGVSDIAHILRVDRTRIPVWVNNWNLYGEAGLLEGHRSGRPREMTGDMLNRLYDIVESGPVAYGLDTGIWNSIVIAEIIEEEFGIKYHQGHVRKLLSQIGFSVQRPRVSLVNADEKTKNRWIRYTFPNLKKKLKQKEALSSMKTKRRSVKTQHFIKHGLPKASNRKS